MAITKVDFKDVKALYELCSFNVDLKEFYAQRGINIRGIRHGSVSRFGMRRQKEQRRLFLRL